MIKFTIGKHILKISSKEWEIQLGYVLMLPLANIGRWLLYTVSFSSKFDYNY